jgi:FHA domain
MVSCPNGHESSSDGFCAECGLPVGPVAVVDPAPGPPPDTCPGCGAARFPEDLFCESCGLDLHAPSATAWTAVVYADRPYFEAAGIEGVPFPDRYPPRTFQLTGDAVRIGRRSTGKAADPEIDLSGSPQDTGISHLHAVLRRGSDGGWTVADLGSRNGTTLNDDARPLEPGRPTALADRDRIHLGAWTTIVFNAPA